MSTVSASELVIFGFDGPTLGGDLKNYLRANKIGGLILFKRNIEDLEQVISLNSDIINAHSKHPPLICVDQEGGRVARLRGIVSDVLALRDLREVFLREPHLAYRVGALMGRELVALGFHLNFAPVCDVAIEQDGKDIIGDRAFSHEAHEVAMLAAKFIQGMQGSGLAGCAKHFPGHGATTTDSHFLLPIVSTSADILEERELAPFRSAIKAEVASIMTAHLIAQNLDEDKPATMSPKIINELLRVKLEFDGVVISDDLDMKAVADHYELKEILRASLESCVDMFIIGNNLEKTYEAIACLDELIKSHDYLAQKAMLAKQRVDKLRSRYVGKALAPDLRQAQHIVKSVPHLELLNSCR